MEQCEAPYCCCNHEEIDGKPVRRVFQHDATTEPHSATYKVNFLAVEV